MNNAKREFVVGIDESLEQTRYRGSVISAISNIPTYESKKGRPILASVEDFLERQAGLIGLDYRHILDQARSVKSIRETLAHQANKDGKIPSNQGVELLD